MIGESLESNSTYVNLETLVAFEFTDGWYKKRKTINILRFELLMNDKC